MRTNTNEKPSVPKSPGVDVNKCYQCGKCSAGCPLAEDMDFPPSVLIRLLQTGSPRNRERVLASRTIWLCVGCEQCVERCPKQVDTPQLMDALRVEALGRGIRPPREVRPVLSFYKAFLDSVRRGGRLSEVLMVVDFKLRTLRLWQDVKNVPALLSRGKLHLFSGRVKAWKMPGKRKSDYSCRVNTNSARDKNTNQRKRLWR